MSGIVPPDAAEEALRACRTAELALDWSGLPPHAPVIVETLDRENGDALSAWSAMGRPETPTREKTALLKEAAAATRKEVLFADATGRFTLNRVIQPCGVLTIRLIQLESR